MDSWLFGFEIQPPKSYCSNIASSSGDTAHADDLFPADSRRDSFLKPVMKSVKFWLPMHCKFYSVADMRRRRVKWGHILTHPMGEVRSENIKYPCICPFQTLVAATNQVDIEQLQTRLSWSDDYFALNYWQAHDKPNNVIISLKTWWQIYSWKWAKSFASDFQNIQRRYCPKWINNT